MRLCNNICNLYLGKLLPVAIFYLIPFTSLLFKDNYLVALNMVNYFGVYLSVLNGWGPNGYFSFVVNKQNLVETHFGAFLCLKAMNKNLLIFLHLKLLSCNIYNSVHYIIILWCSILFGFAKV